MIFYLAIIVISAALCLWSYHIIKQDISREEQRIRDLAPLENGRRPR